MYILEVNDLNVYYGAIHAIKNISFEIKKGEIVTLIGANGAGKTSTLHAVSGLLPIKSGEISLKGINVTGIEGLDYCDKCGSTDIGSASIEEW